MGKTSLSRNRIFISRVPLTMMLIGSYLVLLNCIDREPWRISFAAFAFTGFLSLWIFFRHPEKKEVQKSQTGK